MFSVASGVGRVANTLTLGSSGAGVAGAAGVAPAAGAAAWANALAANAHPPSSASALTVIRRVIASSLCRSLFLVAKRSDHVAAPCAFHRHSMRQIQGSAPAPGGAAGAWANAMVANADTPTSAKAVSDSCMPFMRDFLRYGVALVIFVLRRDDRGAGVGTPRSNFLPTGSRR